MPWVDYRKLCDRLDIIEVLAWMDWQATVRRGDYLRGRCPLCTLAQSPRTVQSQQGREFSVHRHRKLFRCFRCKQGGNILDLWSHYYKIDLHTAAHELTKRLHDQQSAQYSNLRSQPNRPSV